MGDIRAIYNPAASRPSWQKRTGIVIADLFTEGQPLDIAPRSALRKAVESLSDAGYTPQIRGRTRGLRARTDQQPQMGSMEHTFSTLLRNGVVGGPQ